MGFIDKTSEKVKINKKHFQTSVWNSHNTNINIMITFIDWKNTIKNNKKQYKGKYYYKCYFFVFQITYVENQYLQNPHHYKNWRTLNRVYLYSSEDP